jgi:hypothetical protein
MIAMLVIATFAIIATCHCSGDEVMYGEFIDNPTLPPDAVQVAPEYQEAIREFCYREKPTERPIGIPPTCVLVSVYQRVEGKQMRFLGWTYLDAEFVNELHQKVQEEEVPPTTYVGHVRRLDAIFSLKWLPNGKVEGKYFYPKRGINRSYTLLGENSEEGKMYLEEYTDKTLTARIALVKSTTERQIIWSGVMKNVDGRSFEMSFQRDR